MGVFDFLFGSKLTIERLIQILDEEDGETKLKDELKKRNIKDLQKFCLKGCQNLDNEDAQKQIYVNAIMEFIRVKKGELSGSPVPEKVEHAIADSVESKPVEMGPEPGPMGGPEPGPMGGPESGPMGGPEPGPMESSSEEENKRGGKKKKGGRTRRRKGKQQKEKEEKKGGKRRNSRKKCML